MLGLRPSKLVFRPHAGLFLPRQVLIFYLALVQGDGTETKDSQAEGGPYWSLMFEVSESELKAVNNEEESFAGGRWAGVVRECVQGALNTKLIQEDTQIVSLYHRWACFFFPAPGCSEGRSPSVLTGPSLHGAAIPFEVSYPEAAGCRAIALHSALQLLQSD